MNNSAKHIIYKVKTTKPKRYVVRPPQGVVLPGEKAEIFLTMVPADALKLWNDALNQSRSGGKFGLATKYLGIYLDIFTAASHDYPHLVHLLTYHYWVFIANNAQVIY